MDRETIRNLIKAKTTVQPMPCPFCGSLDYVRVEHDTSDPGTFFVACYECNANGPDGVGLGKDAAIMAWNSRKNS
jgi:Lar family restriction alleviation protein